MLALSVAMAAFRLFVTMSGLLLAFFAAYLEAVSEGHLIIRTITDANTTPSTQSIVSTALETIAAALHADEVVCRKTQICLVRRSEARSGVARPDKNRGLIRFHKGRLGVARRGKAWRA